MGHFSGSFATSAPRELRCALGDKPTLCQANAGDFEE